MKLKKINKTQAKKLWDQGKPIIFVGNKVNSYHFFGGWHLAFETSKTECLLKSGYEPECEFQSRVNNFEYYLEPELGSRAAFYIRVG